MSNVFIDHHKSKLQTDPAKQGRQGYVSRWLDFGWGCTSSTGMAARCTSVGSLKSMAAASQSPHPLVDTADCCCMLRRCAISHRSACRPVFRTTKERPTCCSMGSRHAVLHKFRLLVPHLQGGLQARRRAPGLQMSPCSALLPGLQALAAARGSSRLSSMLLAWALHCSPAIIGVLSGRPIHARDHATVLCIHLARTRLVQSLSPCCRAACDFAMQQARQMYLLMR